MKNIVKSQKHMFSKIARFFRSTKEKFITWLIKIGVMNEKAYTLKKKIGTQELHLFEGVFKSDNKCTSDNLSICKEMNKEEKEGNNIFSCKTKKEARMECATIGDYVCGTCVSHLYLTPKK